MPLLLTMRSYLLNITILPALGPVLLLTIFGPSLVLAADFQPQVPIPGMTLIGGKTAGELIASYIVGIYRYGIWLAGGLAVIMIMVGGLTWMLAGGSPARVDAAKGRIGAAITGLGLALVSYLILVGINPKLVSLNMPDIEIEMKGSEAIGQCEEKGGRASLYYFDSKISNPDEDYQNFRTNVLLRCMDLCQEYTGSIDYQDLSESDLSREGQVIGKTLCCTCATPMRKKECLEKKGSILDKFMFQVSTYLKSCEEHAYCLNGVKEAFSISDKEFCCVCNPI